MKHFLVPTDFSKTADIALEFAAQSAKFIPATITIVHAFELVNNMYVDYGGAHREFHEDLTREIQKKLDQVKQEIQKRHDVKINTLLSISRCTWVWSVVTWYSAQSRNAYTRESPMCP